jgi:hypothetical protein
VRAPLLLALVIAAPLGAQSPVVDAHVTVHTDQVVNRFDPRTTFGGGIDGHGTGVVARVFTRDNIAAMKTAGLTMASYRLRTELGVQAWHWNPNGQWSDAAHQRGYWASFDTSRAPILLSHGYRLPRRGTTDESDDRGYSRLDDGDTASFWKSNPYLDHRFTHTPDSLRHPVPVNAARIRWGTPYAVQYKVQYWKGEEVHDVDENPDGRWVTFARGAERSGRGGDELRRLDDAPVTARFVRIVMSAGSSTASATSRDERDAAGYAIRELSVGVASGDSLIDAVRHAPRSSGQSTTYASSTDSWHRAEDIDRDLEQPGLDRVFRSSLTFGRPAMVPVPVLYGTPSDAAAEIRFLRRRGYAIGRIEMGEEPDGQFITPEDYATLYAQTARAIRADWPTAPLGGPGFQGLESRVMFAWPSDSAGDTWIPRFLAALKARGQPGDFNFFSFEWYPWDNICAPTAPQLAEASARLTDRLQQVQRDGIGTDLPMVIAEYGYSAFAGRAQVSIEGALLNADIVGRFLALGGDELFLYGWEPTSLDKSPRCDGWGNNMLFLADDQRRIKARVATYYGARLVTKEWTQPRGGVHVMYAAETDARDADGNELLSAYVLRRPDGTWATLLVNKDPAHAYRVALPVGAARTAITYGPAQYEWKDNGPAGRPARSQPSVKTWLAKGASVVVPAYSMVVLR